MAPIKHFPHLTMLLPNVVFGLIYFAVALGSLRLSYAGEVLTFIWPPAGIAVAAFLLYGYRIAPGIFLAAAAVAALAGAGTFGTLFMGSGVVAEAALARLLLQKFGFSRFLGRQRDALLLLLVGILCTSISAGVGILGLFFQGIVRSGDELYAFAFWWCSNATGVLVVTPFILVWTRERPTITVRRTLEAVIGIAFIILLCSAMFTELVPLGGRYPIGFIVFPVMILAGLRFGARGATLTTNIAILILVAGTSWKQGPYAFAGVESLYIVWLYTSILGATTLAAITLWEESKRAEIALRASQEKFRHLVENINDVIFNIDNDGRFSYISPVVERLSGYTSAEIEGRLFSEFVYEEDLPALFQSLQQTMQGEVSPAVFRTRARDGTFHYVSTSSRLLYENGQPTGITGVLTDVTNEYLAREELRRREAHLRTAVENLPFDFWICDAEGRYTYQNWQSIQRWGEHIGKSPAELDLPKYIIDDWSQSNARALAGETVHKEVNYEYLGERLEFHKLVAPVLDNERIIGLLGVNIDIKAERQAQRQALLAQREREIILDTVPAFIWVKDEEDRILRINSFAAVAFGQAIRDIEGRFTSEFFPKDASRLHERDLEVIQLGEARLGITELFEFPDGKQRWLQMNKIPFTEPTNAAPAVMIFALDVTERVNAERKLRESEQRLELGLHGADLGMWDWNVTTGRTVFNERWAEMLGYTTSDVEEHYTFWEDHLHPDDKPRVLSTLEAHMLGEEPLYECEYRMVTKSGDFRWILSRGKAVEHDRNGRPSRVTGTHLDIHERKVAEQERARLETQIQQAQKLESLGILAGGIAHDFNNLLVGILGNADLALLEMSAETPGRSYIQSITQAAQRAAELCRQMLAYSGRGKFVVEPINLNQLVREMAHLLEVSISKKAILKLRFADDLYPMEADATQIRQVVMNLIVNASEAIGEKSGVITLTTGMVGVDEAYLTISGLTDSLKPGLFVMLEVADTGCGMDAETRAKVFDPFFTTKFTGRGLGMAAVQGIVRGHGGAIRIYSELGRGTTFKLLFPASTSARVVDRQHGDKQIEWRASGTVLVIDDEPGVRAIARHTLEHFGFNVITADDGAEGIELFREHQDVIRAVLLDMTMPHVSGEEAFRAIRLIDQSACVILTSGYNEREVTQFFSGKGLAGFIQKPFRAQELIEKFREVLQSRGDDGSQCSDETRIS